MTKIRTFAGLLIVAAIIYSGLWYTSSFQARKDTEAMLGGWRDKGLKVEHGKVKLSGFPYRIVITVDGLQVQTRGPGLDFGAESVTLVSHLWTPGHWVAEATNVRVQAAGEALAFTDGSMRGSYRIHDDGKAVIAIDSGNMADFSLMKAPGLEGPKRLKGWQLFLRSDTAHHEPENGLYEDRFLDFKLTVDTGATQIETSGGIMGPIVKGWTARDLGAWRDAGGLLELDAIKLDAGGGRLGGNASLTLDEDFRPLGSATFRVLGRDAIAATLKDMGLENAASAIARAGEDDLSVMLQMGSLTLEGEPVMPLKPLLED
ncbi:DUF2125 domain-containing protein [Kordiimonas lipolytica]|uniref:DUF2125 domain-containing protein n=1 Tax=Kordiimonas lipolytica TaxID=1662421 RepID=A0ABV8UCD7_9PROT|nr:DUF2125 domain-containing protein [Kordiimonas lipolytica]